MVRFDATGTITTGRVWRLSAQQSVQDGSIVPSPACQDGNDNDGDGRIDFDGGASFGLPAGQQTVPDPQCGVPEKRREKKACGLGFELAGLALVWRLRPMLLMVYTGAHHRDVLHLEAMMLQKEDN